MEKIDFKKTMRALYAPKARDFKLVDVPEMQFLMLDGQGDPDGAEYAAAVGWLYPVAYALKFASKIDLGRDYVVPPLEALWWAEDYEAYRAGRREEWEWRSMLMVPDWIGADMFEVALAKAAKKKGTPPEGLRMERYAEGLSVQILHLGPYSDEAETLARLHDEFIPENGLKETGYHHEIYLSDPRKVAPEKLKTVLRQPVERVN